MGNGHAVTFTYSARQRWALLPTAAFLVVIFLVVWLQPTLLWGNTVDDVTRSSALFLAGVLAIFVTFMVLRRWLSPFEIRLERDELVAKPLLGPARHVPYTDIVGMEEKPKTFFRHAPDLVLRVRNRPLVLIGGDIKGYEQLQRSLRHRVRPQGAAPAH